MKKIFLSTFVIVSFIFYAVYQRSVAPHLPPIISFHAPSEPVAPNAPRSATFTAPLPSVSRQKIQRGEGGDEEGNTRHRVSQTPAPLPAVTPVAPPPNTRVANGIYRDGEYLGKIADAYYGNVQVKAVVQNGRVADALFLDYPQDRRTSVQINRQAMPLLKMEAIQVQRAPVDIVSGATQTSLAFNESFASALLQAKI